MTPVHDSIHYWGFHLMVRGLGSGSGKIAPPFGWPSFASSLEIRSGLDGGRWVLVSLSFGSLRIP